MSTLKAELLAKSYKGREVVKNVGLEVKSWQHCWFTWPKWRR